MFTLIFADRFGRRPTSCKNKAPMSYTQNGGSGDRDDVRRYRGADARNVGRRRWGLAPSAGALAAAAAPAARAPPGEPSAAATAARRRRARGGHHRHVVPHLHPQPQRENLERLGSR